jgi:hypothetical protein
MKSSDEIYTVEPFGSRERVWLRLVGEEVVQLEAGRSVGVPGVINLRGEHVPPQMGSIRPISPAQLAGDLLRCQHYQAHGFFH